MSFEQTVRRVGRYAAIKAEKVPSKVWMSDINGKLVEQVSDAQHHIQQQYYARARAELERALAHIEMLQNLPTSIAKKPDEPVLYWVPATARFIGNRPGGEREYWIDGQHGASVILARGMLPKIVLRSPMSMPPVAFKNWYWSLPEVTRDRLVNEVRAIEPRWVRKISDPDAERCGEWYLQPPTARNGAIESEIVNWGKMWQRRKVGKWMSVEDDWWQHRGLGEDSFANRLCVTVPSNIWNLLVELEIRWHVLMIPQVAGIYNELVMNGDYRKKCVGSIAYRDTGAPANASRREYKGSIAWAVDVSWQNLMNGDYVARGHQWVADVSDILDEYSSHLKRYVSQMMTSAGALETCRSWGCLGLCASGNRIVMYNPVATKVDKHIAYYQWSQSGGSDYKRVNMELQVYNTKTGLRQVKMAAPVYKALVAQVELPYGVWRNEDWQLYLTIPTKYVKRAKRALAAVGTEERSRALLEVLRTWNVDLAKRRDKGNSRNE